MFQRIKEDDNEDFGLKEISHGCSAHKIKYEVEPTDHMRYFCFMGIGVFGNLFYHLVSMESLRYKIFNRGK